MSNDLDRLVDKHVTYALEINSKFFLIENVPARVNEETGEQFFSPATVELLQEIILDGRKPERVIEIPVYSYAS